MSPEITFGPDAAETVLEQFGKTTDDEDYIIDEESEEREKSYYKEEEIHIEELGGLIDGSVGLVKDDFTEIHEYVKDKESDGDD
ncbi:hypothetical protein [Halobacterium noricense]|uniref:hypothetical protein n=1 Tax=Halobacterium noricense TaxID=223182 RepID=UPI001E3DA730|nr:hypothetical protein [Halobacterium noricense]UHH26128.1 hypothetical protein LT974_04145 [Halobacterium noricense]